jgi:alkylation response protein AidB-like acyl-CoA dehydrogenase
MLTFLLGGPPPEPGAPPIDHALAEAVAATTVAAAFLAGYRAALRALVPSLPPGARTCLCASEEGGAHPRAIRTTLTPVGNGWQLDGRKKFVTGGPLADSFLVVASTGTDAQGRPMLRVARVQAGRAGVTLHPMGDLPFVPEIPHAEVSFDHVEVDEVLPGDGYTGYLKPFRTVEDCHVFAAVLAHLFGTATRLDWPHELRQRLLATLVALRSLALADPRSPDTHLALAGALDLGRQVVAKATTLLETADPDLRARWQRDLPLLMVAQRAREARAAAAWEAVTARKPATL